MVAGSVLDQDWLPVAQDSPGPYMFVAEGVLAYLAQAPQVIARIAERFPGALIAFDSYSQRTLEQLPLASRIMGDMATVTLFRSSAG
jgi:O-methyltransferase involved in polyketide biosynthesis